MQCLSSDDWKIVAHLPVPAGEVMLSRILDYGWIESRSEKQRTAIRLTPAGLKALRSAVLKPSAG
jgi:hypothetical protein